MNVVILAAGQGTRMHSTLPKVLQPLAGRPLLDYVLAAARQLLGVQRICVVHGHGAEAVQAVFGEQALCWALQLPQLGTGHAVAQALPHLGEQGLVMVLYGDVPLIEATTLSRLAALADEQTLALLTATVENADGLGRIVRNVEGEVCRIVEERDANAEQQAIREVNTGILVAPLPQLRRWLTQIGNDNAQGEYYLTDVIALAREEGLRIVTTQPDGDWEIAGVNSKAQLAALERICQRNIARRLMDEGVSVLDPARLDVRGKLVCGRDVELDVGSVFLGQVVLGDGVSVGAYCVLRDVELGENVQIAAFSHLDGVSIGRDCRIGPYARLRPGTRLAAGVHVGNFVEIKNSQVAADSKLNHLSYVGDAELGQRVNIGAGTITCNYDGVDKHLTVIEDDAFIGSDCQLVAPVRVGRGATLAAGTTLTSDAPADQLTVSRARQKSLSDWKRPTKKRSEPSS